MAIRRTGTRGLYTDGTHLYTRNAVPGRAVYGEALVQEGGAEYRQWAPDRSKLAALLQRRPAALDLPRKGAVLYLGAGSGTTASHVCDLVPGGRVFAVEKSREAFEQLLHLAQGRGNLIPLLADARTPETYAPRVGRVDLLYQDVAQRDQAAIFLAHVPFLKGEGAGLLMVKARSVDVTALPKDVFRRVREALEEGGLTVEAVVPLDPHQRDHAAFALRP